MNDDPRHTPARITEHDWQELQVELQSQRETNDMLELRLSIQERINKEQEEKIASLEQRLTDLSAACETMWFGRH